MTGLAVCRTLLVLLAVGWGIGRSQDEPVTRLEALRRIVQDDE